MAIVFLGTPAFAVPSLRRLAAEGFEIAAVYTQPDRPAGRGRHPAPPPLKTAALELGLQVRQPESLRDPAALAELAALQPEAGVGVAYGQILPQEVLDIPPRGGGGSARPPPPPPPPPPPTPPPPPHPPP